MTNNYENMRTTKDMIVPNNLIKKQDVSEIKIIEDMIATDLESFVLKCIIEVTKEENSFKTKREPGDFNYLCLAISHLNLAKEAINAYEQQKRQKRKL